MESSLTLAPDVCFRNRAAGPGGCINKCPDLLPHNSALLDLFNASEGSLNTVGVDGVPIGRNVLALRELAEAYSLPWDEHTLTCIRILESAWLTADYRERRQQQNRKRVEAMNS